MPKRVDTAYIEFLPDFTGFDAAVTRSVNTAMQHVERTVDKTADEVSHSFDEVERDIQDVFNDIARSGEIDFNEVVRVAQRTALVVDESFQLGNESAEHSFQELQVSANRDMDQMARHAETSAAKVKGSFSFLGLVGSGALLGIGAAATAGLGALSAFGLKSAASLEQTQISFNSLLGSAEQGQKVFKDLQQFANVTPFEFTDVSAAAKRFLAFHDSVGLTADALQNYLTTVGNVISVTGGSGEAFSRISLAIGQIGSTSKVTLDNLNQIADAIPGFSPISAIAKSLGISTAEAMQQVSAGSISAQQGVQALLQGMAAFPGAAGAMEKQSQTLLGVFSTFHDVISQTLAQSFAPAIPAIKDSLTQITPILGEALGQIAPLLGQIIAGLGPLFGLIVQTLVPILSPVLELVTGLLDQLQKSGALKGLADALGLIFIALEPLFPVLALVATTLANALIPVVTDLAPIISDLVEILVDLLPALVPLIPPLLELVAAALEMAEPFLKLTALILKFISIEALTPIVKLLAIAITGLAEGISFLAQWIGTIDWDKVGAGIMVALKAVGNFFVGIWHFIESIPDRIAAGLKALPGLLLRGLDAALKAIGFGIGLMIAAFIAFPQLALNAIINFPHDFVAFIEGMWGVITKLWNDHIDEVVGFFVKLPGRLVEGLKLGWHVVSDFFVSSFKNLNDFASNAVGNIIGFFVNLPSRLSSFGADVGNGILNWLKARLNSVIDGVNAGIAHVDDALPGITLPRLPHLARGGIALGPAIIGEDARTAPEMALPLNDNRAMSMVVNAFNQAGANGGGQPVIANNVTVVVEIDGQQLQGRIVKTIEDSNRSLKASVSRRR